MCAGLSWLMLSLLAFGTNQGQAYSLGSAQQPVEDHVPVLDYQPELRSFAGHESSWEPEAYDESDDYSLDEDDDDYSEPDLDPRGAPTRPKCKPKNPKCKPKMKSTTAAPPSTTTKRPCPMKLPHCRPKKPACPQNRPCAKKPPVVTPKPDCPPQTPCPHLPYPYPHYWPVYNYPGHVHPPQPPQYPPHFPWPPQLQHHAQSLGQGHSQGHVAPSQGQGVGHSPEQAQIVAQNQGQVKILGQGHVGPDQAKPPGQGPIPVQDKSQSLGQGLDLRKHVGYYNHPPVQQNFRQHKRQWKFPRVSSSAKQPHHGYIKLPFHQSAWQWRY